MTEMHMHLGKWTERDLDRILSESSRIRDTGKRIDFLSRQFLDLPYSGSTLIGSVDVPEAFVINLEGVDCLTFLEYVEAMRLSVSFSAFKENLKKIRYGSGEVSFYKRNHFFTDWIKKNSDSVADVTGEIGSGKTARVRKLLNKKEDGTFFVPGIEPVTREIVYIPGENIDKSVLHRLGTGTYVGIYSLLAGLDVSHTGIFIKDGDKSLLRHASSSENKMKVADEDFMEYMSGKPGIIVLGAKSYAAFENRKK